MRQRQEIDGRKEEKTLHFIPRVHNLAGEEEFNPCQEGAPKRYVTEYNHKEEEKRKYEERRMTREIKETSKELNKRGDEELIEEIIKLLKNRNIMEKVVKRISEDQRDHLEQVQENINHQT